VASTEPVSLRDAAEEHAPEEVLEQRKCDDGGELQRESEGDEDSDVAVVVAGVQALCTLMERLMRLHVTMQVVQSATRPGTLRPIVHTHPFNRTALFRDYPGEPVPER